MLSNSALKKLPITSITPFTFQDYPEHTACILWFSGCNMACGYCHNPELVKGELRKLPPEQVAAFLESRSGLLEGVVLSGGECTLCPALPEFARYLKLLGYKVKIDTNGTNPDLLEQLLREELVDYVALDFKAPEAKFQAITGFSDYALFERSLALLCESGIPLEVRTTVHMDMLSEADITVIIQTLHDCGFQGTYALQNFRAGRTLKQLPATTIKFDLMQLPPTNFEISFRNF